MVLLYFHPLVRIFCATKTISKKNFGLTSF